MIHLPLLLLLDAGGPNDDLSAALLSLETVACAYLMPCCCWSPSRTICLTLLLLLEIVVWAIPIV